MTEKRYYNVDYDEEYYIFDSNTISKEEVEEKSEYSYDVFADSLTIKEILELLNENVELDTKCSQLEKENDELKQEIKKLETFKKILDYAEKDMEERVDWQSYCEKEFEGL